MVRNASLSRRSAYIVERGLSLMFFKKAADILSSEITPKRVYLSRRTFLEGAAVAGATTAAPRRDAGCAGGGLPARAMGARCARRAAKAAGDAMSGTPAVTGTAARPRPGARRDGYSYSPPSERRTDQVPDWPRPLSPHDCNSASTGYRSPTLREVAFGGQCRQNKPIRR